MTSSRTSPSSYMTSAYDASSGQVFAERTSKVTSMIDSWADKTTGSTWDLQHYRSRNGPPTLWRISERTLLVNLSGLTAEALRPVPWPIAKKIWQRIKKAQLASFRTWRTFAAVYHAENDAELDHSVDIRLWELPVSHYLRAMDMPASQCVTRLSVFKTHLSIADHKAIGQIPSLRALYIMTVRGLDDRAVRSWSQHAREGGGFANLQVLMLSKKLDLSPRSLDDLAALPALVAVLVDLVDFFKDGGESVSRWNCLQGKLASAKVKEPGRFSDTEISSILFCLSEEGYPSEKEPDSAAAQGLPKLDVLFNRFVPSVKALPWKDPVTGFFTCFGNYEDLHYLLLRAPMPATSEAVAEATERDQHLSTKRLRKLRAEKRVDLESVFSELIHDPEHDRTIMA